MPAAGVILDSPRDISAWAAQIYDRSVVTQTMPLANLTQMTDEERIVLARWFAGGAHTE